MRKGISSQRLDKDQEKKRRTRKTTINRQLTKHLKEMTMKNTRTLMHQLVRHQQMSLVEEMRLWRKKKRIHVILLRRTEVT